MSFSIKKCYCWPVSRFYRVTKGALSPECLCNKTRCIFDEFQCVHWMDKDKNILYGELETEDAEQHIRIVVHFLDECIQLNCLTPDLELPGKELSNALLFCNKWNCNDLFLNTFVEPDSSRFATSYCVGVMKGTSNRFLKEKVIGPFFVKNLEFFKKAYSVFAETPKGKDEK